MGLCGVVCRGKLHGEHAGRRLAHSRRYPTVRDTSVEARRLCQGAGCFRRTRGWGQAGAKGTRTALTGIACRNEAGEVGRYLEKPKSLAKTRRPPAGKARAVRC